MGPTGRVDLFEGEEILSGTECITTSTVSIYCLK